MTNPNNSIPKYTYLVVILLIVAAIFAYFKIADRVTPGSFEYINKGEKLFDKDKYPEAIKYYEKAREASPESDLIKSHLVNAYSRYAAIAADGGNYDTGVEYLAKAHDLVRNRYTMQNLALMYGKRALYEAQSGRQEKAVKDLEAALETAEDSVNAKRNLSILLYNSAVGEYKVKRHNTAIMLLEAAAAARENAYIYELLGDIYYEKNNPDEARAYYDRAYRIGPDNSRAREKLEKAEESGRLALEHKPVILPNFDIRHEEGLVIDIDLVGRILQRAYSDVGGDLDYFPADRTVVFFYSEGSFRRIFRLPVVVRAFYDGNIRVPYPETPLIGNELSSYLYHEYTHAVISAVTRNSCPVWLNEGIAVFEEIKWTRPGAHISLKKDIDREGRLSFQALDAEFTEHHKYGPAIADSYLLAFTAVDYIVDRWGMKGLNAVLKRIAGGQHAVNAIDDEFLVSEKEFYNGWREHILNE
ncbi:MAG: tetratricopeptide repeat protein [Candidatus Omnitrophica bacterium]|nr:tetratricopeptide repeat protein [Candidatus Omnitrophota bacterium]